MANNQAIPILLEKFNDENNNFYMLFVDSPTGGYRSKRFDSYKHLDIEHVSSDVYFKELKKHCTDEQAKEQQKKALQRAAALKKLQEERPDLDKWLVETLSKPYEEKTSKWVVENLLTEKEVNEKLYEAYLFMRQYVDRDWNLFG